MRSASGNLRKLEIVSALDKLAADLGVSLAHLALAFVRSHPAISSVIIGPRTHDQLTDLLAGADLELSGETLDRIDEIVPPGTDVNPSDIDYAPPALTDSALRRRVA